MKDTEILSTLHPVPGSNAWAAGVERPLVFDACHVGVVLRAVLFVQAVVGVGSLFAAPPGWDGLLDLLAWSVSAQTAVLLWLTTACLLKQGLGRWSMPVQAAVGVGLGAEAGAFAQALLVWLGLTPGPRWLACVLAGALMAGVLVAGLVWRARAQLPAGTSARLAELQSRIRPHFLFNTLNSAIALIRAEPARAEAMLEDLSELFRSALANPHTESTLAEELQLAERYLAIEQVRFGPRLRLEWALDPSTHDARLPPLILQPLVENAVKHGVEPSAQGADIRISTQRRGEHVLIKVTNTVPAGSGEPGMGLALSNVKERLALMHDLQASLRTAQVDGVFQARLEVPLS